MDICQPTDSTTARRLRQPDFAALDIVHWSCIRHWWHRVEEIKHKSNFANEQLRAHRRNKFMVELLAAIRRVVYQSSRPEVLARRSATQQTQLRYSVAVSDAEAVAARAAKAEKTEGSRLFPTGTSFAELLPSAVGGGFLSPAQAMYPGLKQRVAHNHEDSSGRRASAWDKRQ